MIIPFNTPPRTGHEAQYVLAAMKSEKLSGDGHFTHLCQQWFEKQLGCHKTLLTPSCTQALEMAALLIDIQPGDEIIMPSYTFVSTANAFVLRGAKIVFIDIRPDTMNMDESLIEAAITNKTKAIVPVHYAGVACDMSRICAIAQRHSLFVIEDAAQAMMASIDSKPLGTWGHMAAFSFHETKNVTSGGEGGLLIINDERFGKRAEIIREKGTNRSLFFRGLVDKYTWVDTGSSYLPSELQAAYLWGQLEQAQHITDNRLNTWQKYYTELSILLAQGNIKLPSIPANCQQNGHMFYIKCKDLAERTAFIAHMKKNGIGAVFHYVPLHSAPAGMHYSRFHGEDLFTTQESERLVRLPLWYGMADQQIKLVTQAVYDFYGTT